jgi:hypothetical protein
MDDKGISAAFFVSIQDTTPIQQIFLTLALTKPYPAILNLSRGVKYKHIDLPYTRIDGSAQCSSSSSNHFVVFRMLQSSRHKIYRIDTRTGATETITQFSAEHKSSKVGYEPVAMAMRDCDTVLAAWKSGDGAVSVERYTLVSGKWTTTTMDVANVYRQLATY